MAKLAQDRKNRARPLGAPSGCVLTPADAHCNPRRAYPPQGRMGEAHRHFQHGAVRRGLLRSSRRCPSRFKNEASVENPWLVVYAFKASILEMNHAIREPSCGKPPE